MAASFAHLLTISREAIDAGVVPGLAMAVGQGGQTPLHAAFGHRQLEPEILPASESTIWDLASLTKALCTSVLCMQAVAEGRASLSEPLEPPAAEPTVRQTLAHAAGFEAHRRLYAEVLVPGGARPGSSEARAQVLRLAAAGPLAYPPGSKSIYSDLDFILLGAWLEARLGAPLERLFQERVATPLGLSATELGFRREDEAGFPPPAASQDMAATQRCQVRGRVLVGEVDDLNAHALGGVAGHAGLFGTVGAVAALAHALCAAYRGAGVSAGSPPLVDRQVLRTFWTPAGIPGSTWRLGWDGPAPTGSLAGDRLSRSAVGHLAFTGCSLWIDPEAETFVVVLSNRVHPVPRIDPRFAGLRRSLNDAALEAIGYRSRS